MDKNANITAIEYTEFLFTNEESKYKKDELND
jgi:hypothetical protein